MRVSHGLRYVLTGEHSLPLTSVPLTAPDTLDVDREDKDDEVAAAPRGDEDVVPAVVLGGTFLIFFAGMCDMYYVYVI